MFILGVDPSGSFKEGWGTTGLCLFDSTSDIILQNDSICAKNFSSDLSYWKAHLDIIDLCAKEYKGLVLSVEDYILYENKALTQINSKMETCQLIGIIKMHCYLHRIPVYFRNAVVVKQRWANSILERKGYIYKKGKTWYNNQGKKLSNHDLDAIRHAVHYAHFKK